MSRLELMANVSIERTGDEAKDNKMLALKLQDVIQSISEVDQLFSGGGCNDDKGFASYSIVVKADSSTFRTQFPPLPPSEF